MPGAIDIESVETYEEAQLRLAEEIDNGRRMKVLLADGNFTHLFEELYLKAFAITNVFNYAAYDEVTRTRLHEKMAARSHFSNFCQDIVARGNMAVNELNEIKVNSMDSGDDTEEHN